MTPEQEQYLENFKVMLSTQQQHETKSTDAPIKPTHPTTTRGRPVKPNLSTSEGNELLNAPSLEWAARRVLKYHDGEIFAVLYEFIGKDEELLALGLVSPDMLPVESSSGKQRVEDEHGSKRDLQRLANDRTRLEVRIVNDREIQALDALMEHRREPISEPQLEPPSNSVPATVPANPVPEKQYDDKTVHLKAVSALITKFPGCMREKLSVGMFGSKGNGWQLLESFPWLAVCIYASPDNKMRKAKRLVKKGAKLREIAERAGVPMSFKRLTANVCSTRLVKISDLLYDHPELVSHHCPKTINKQRAWILAIETAQRSGNEEFAVWTGIHWQEVSSQWKDVPLAVLSLNDWIKAGVIEEALGSGTDTIRRAMIATGYKGLGANLKCWYQELTTPVPAGRTFDLKMSASTVLRLSEEWHERAAETEAADVEFPEPWYEGDTLGEYRIEPVVTSAKLTRYAQLFRNCASTYAERIARGDIFIYVVFSMSVPQEAYLQSPEAMFELKANNGYRSLGQLSGPRNRSVKDELKTAVRGWLESKRAPIGGAS